MTDSKTASSIPFTIPGYKKEALLKETLSTLFSRDSDRVRISEFVLLEDSRDSNDIDAAVELCQYLQKTFGVKSSAITYAEKQAMRCKILDGDKALEEPLDFALFGMKELEKARGAGANRNAQILHFAGRDYACADDDILFTYHTFCRPLSWSAHRNADGLTMPISAFFSDAGKLRLEGKTGFFKHKEIEPYLGSPFSDFINVLGKTPEELDLHHESSPKEAVRVAVTGIYGGRWFNGAHMARRMEHALISRLWKNEAEFEEADLNPWCIQLIPEMAVSAVPFLVNSHYALRNSEFLPPYLYHARAEDDLFVSIFRVCYPDSGVCHLPFAVGHSKDVKEVFLKGKPGENILPTSKLQGGSSVNAILSECFRICSCDIHEKDPEKRIKQVSRSLLDIASLSDKSRRELFMTIHLRKAAGEMADLQNRIDLAGGRPSYWAKELEHQLETQKKYTSLTEPFNPMEFVNAGYAENGEHLFVEYIKQTAQLFDAWAELRRKAEAINKAEGDS
ncbi:MAG: hypothetical protein Ta2G_15270 [Termitinemataceae bacterium]|nr:MAG: hypothetical protein Ta2G_15270 [Termitinemataceae bacterium]